MRSHGTCVHESALLLRNGLQFYVCWQMTEFPLCGWTVVTICIYILSLSLYHLMDISVASIFGIWKYGCSKHGDADVSMNILISFPLAVYPVEELQGHVTVLGYLFCFSNNWIYINLRIGVNLLEVSEICNLNKLFYLLLWVASYQLKYKHF